MVKNPENFDEINRLATRYFRLKDPKIANQLFICIQKYIVIVVDIFLKKNKTILERDDLIQECLMIIWKKIDKFDAERGEFTRFISMIARQHLRTLAKNEDEKQRLKRSMGDETSTTNNNTCQ